MDKTIADLLSRRSIRKYKSQQINNEDLQTVIEAGLYAPTAKGEQPWLFIVVQQPRMMEKIVKMNAAVLGASGNPYYGAPTVVLVLAKADAKEPVCDAALAIGNMANAAHALGLGSCWINREKEMFASEEGKKLLAELGVSGEYMGVGALSLGYPADGEAPAPKPRRDGTVIFVK